VSNQYYVEIGGSRSPGITKVTGLSEGETTAIDVPDGGSSIVRKVPSGVYKFPAITLERYVDGSAEDGAFKSWFQDAFDADAGDFRKPVRRDGAIVKYQNGVEVMRFVFRGAWVRNSTFSDLEAGSANLFKQTVTLEHDGLKRVFG
jgi:phage tail-like protein